MSTKIKNMTSGNPLRLIILFALPLMLGNIFQQLYTVVDTIVVGNFLSVAGLAALGASDWLNWGMLGTIQGFAQGFSIKMAQNFGAENYKELRRNIVDSIVLAVVLSIILIIIGQLIALPVLQILNTPDDIIHMTLSYIRIMFMGVPIVMAYNLLASVLRALGDSKTPLNAMIVASIVNICLDLLFVVIFKFGIAGAAIATLIAQLISSLYCLYFISKIDVIRLSRNDFIVSFKQYGNLLLLGSPMAFQNLIIAVGGMYVQSVVNDCGVIFIAGFTATNKLYGLLEIAATSFGYAMVTYTGQNLGAGNIKRIKDGYNSATIVSIIVSVVIGLAMVFFGKSFLKMFISGKPDEVIEALKVAYTYLLVMAIPLPILYILHVTRSTLQGLGNTVLPMVSGIIELVMRCVTVMILPAKIGSTGIFYAEPLAWVGADVVLLISYFYLINKQSDLTV